MERLNYKQIKLATRNKRQQYLIFRNLILADIRDGILHRIREEKLFPAFLVDAKLVERLIKENSAKIIQVKDL